ncbi:MAG: cytoplasmic protein [Kluyvera sp.]|uniref:cytoplasmic protein n=1 Tax=Kluyvera sp. TaxID=1538228 RepID=UPI003A875DD5
MSTLFIINTCKTFGCRNLGLPVSVSADYRWPDYRLGYPALHCRACGSYPPLFDEQQFSKWLSAHLSADAFEKGHFCPVCFHDKSICYGYNPLGTQRIQCRACKKVWTPKRHLQRAVAPPERIETVALIVPFQGSCAKQKLYVLLSFDALNGNILHLSTNFTPLQSGDTLHYRWKGNSEPELHDCDILKRVNMRSAQFLRRSQFDEIQYGSAQLKRNARGAILRPVITAHGHFRALHIRFPAVKIHAISHESFIRGAVITAWAELFRQRLGEIWFVEEEIIDSDAHTPWYFKGAMHHGWWKNRWQLWEQEKNSKMVCLLTTGNKNHAQELSLAASRRYIHWLYQQPAFVQSAQCSAGHVTQILHSLASDYNDKLTGTASAD